MNKIFTIIFYAITSTFLTAQVQPKKESLKDNIEKSQDDNTDIYQLFPTQNIWTFIKLNTRDGRMWQVQFSMKDSGIITELNSISLVTKEMELNGRFTLYQTENIWTFILLDQINGDTWQVQWSNEEEKRGIFRLY